MSAINHTKEQVEKTQQAVIDQVINLGIPPLARKIFNHITTAKLMELCKVSKTWRQLIVDEKTRLGISASANPCSIPRPFE